jgi:hypothetical protein
MKLNQQVNWKECPPSVPASPTRIRGISPCGKYALLDWVGTPVFVKDLSLVESPSQYPYKDWTVNHWDRDVDLSTGENLLYWVKSHE